MNQNKSEPEVKPIAKTWWGARHKNCDFMHVSRTKEECENIRDFAGFKNIEIVQVLITPVLDAKTMTGQAQATPYHESEQGLQIPRLEPFAASSEAPTVKEEEEKHAENIPTYPYYHNIEAVDGKLVVKEIASSPDCESSVIKSLRWIEEVATHLSNNQYMTDTISSQHAAIAFKARETLNIMEKSIQPKELETALKFYRMLKSKWNNGEDDHGIQVHWGINQDEYDFILKAMDNSQSYPKSASSCSSEATKEEYPTREAYELACKALWKHRDENELLHKKIEELDGLKCKAQVRYLETKGALDKAIEALETIEQSADHFSEVEEVASKALKEIKGE